MKRKMIILVLSLFVLTALAGCQTLQHLNPFNVNQHR